VQDLPIGAGGVVVGREVGGHAELLEDDGLPEPTGELAGECGRERLARLVVLHRVRVRPEEVHERRELAQRVAVVAARRLDPPGAVAERDGLGRTAGAQRLHDEPRPRRDLVRRRRAAVERHLVRDEPADDRRVAGVAGRELLGEPRLLRDEPHVAVQVTAPAPRGIPVLAGHVADEDRRDRAQPQLVVDVEEVREPAGDGLVDAARLGDEVGPEAERARRVEPVARQRLELLAYDRRVVAGPHARPARPRPEVDAEPAHWGARLVGHAWPSLRRLSRSRTIRAPASRQGHRRPPAVP
jgi:hypothetical protein